MLDSGRLLDAVVKANDLRGRVPDELDESLAAAVGSALVEVLDRFGERPRYVVVGHDMRASSPALAAALATGVTGAGVDVVDIGLASTDLLYFASGSRGMPGAMITASHNPAAFNGIKICRAGAAPMGRDSGLRELRAGLASRLDDKHRPDDSASPGRVSHEDFLPAYAAYLHSLVDVSGLRLLRIVVDAGNGMAGLTVPAVLGPDGPAGGSVHVEPLFFELDGTFPNHEANPLDESTLAFLKAAVTTGGADLGLAFDGDADRCFVVDERGSVVDPSALTALIAEAELAREPGATVLHNLITSRVVADVVRQRGGNAVRTKVGHSFIKAKMAETGAIFGGEHSGHFYFRDFWRADSGMLAALHTIAALGKSPAGTRLSSLVAQYRRTCMSGEVNRVVPDTDAVIAQVRGRFASRQGVAFDDLDGLTVTGPDWWFNIRPSNTESLLRLNVEAPDERAMTSIRDEVLALLPPVAGPDVPPPVAGPDVPPPAAGAHPGKEHLR